MASEANSSLLINTLDLIKDSSTQQERNTRSAVYKYSRKLNANKLEHDRNSRKLIYCSKCSYGGSSTTNLWNYLKLRY